MESRAKILGHPIHQMLIVLPLGLLTGAVAFDIVNLITRGADWSIVSYWLIVAGVIGGLTAAVFGLVDYLAIPGNTRAKRIGRLHGIGNVIVVGLFIVSWFMRGTPLRHPPTAAFVLSFIGIALALVTGWLGGELVDRLSVGVDDNANLDAPSSLSVEKVPGGRAA